MTEKEELESIIDLLTTPAWGLIVKDISLHYDAINKVQDIHSVEELYRIKGELAKLGWFMNLKDWYLQIIENNEQDTV